MTRIVGAALFGLLVAGCATDASVKKQIDPLADRVTALEKAQASTNAKLDAQASELAALKKNSSDASARAEQSAKEAAAAAERADAAAQKATKAFELQQVKGGAKKM
jgi:hypothetical protein